MFKQLLALVLCLGMAVFMLLIVIPVGFQLAEALFIFSPALFLLTGATIWAGFIWYVVYIRRRGK